MTEYRKGGDPAHQAFPENRAKDHNGTPIPTAQQMKEEAIRDARIAREKAMYEQGFAGGNSNQARDEARERARRGRGER